MDPIKNEVLKEQEKLKAALEKAVSEYAVSKYNFEATDHNAEVMEWYKVAINTFIEYYLKDKLGESTTVKYIIHEPVKTLDMTNNIFSWKVKSDNALIMISFNDLDFVFNALTSFDIPDPESSKDFYKREVEFYSVDECIRFIVNELHFYEEYKW